jgi:hypothetical protein
VLLPIVYNALVLREELHGHPLLAAVHAALRPTSYWPLLMWEGVKGGGMGLGDCYEDCLCSASPVWFLPAEVKSGSVSWRPLLRLSWTSAASCLIRAALPHHAQAAP